MCHLHISIVDAQSDSATISSIFKGILLEKVGRGFVLGTSRGSASLLRICSTLLIVGLSPLSRFAQPSPTSNNFFTFTSISSKIPFLMKTSQPSNNSQRLKTCKRAAVLLDNEMEARIADFGLTKAVPEAHTHVTTSNVAGTMGYIAPKYYQTFKFTEKCDIYSFGVLLGGMVIGKMPSDEFFQHIDEMGLVKWMRNVMTSEDPKRAIDPNLLGSGYEEQMLLVLKIACFCTLDSPKERPNSKDARCMLSQIKNDCCKRN